MKNTPQQLHIPVLLASVLDVLAPKGGETYLDLTAGYGGHAREVIARIGDEKLATLVDRDENAIRELRNQCGFTNLIHSDFLSAAKSLAEQEKHFDMILLDLGVSSPQLDLGERGFSFMHDGPLDMRMDQNQIWTAWELVNRSSEKDLAKIIVDYGEESPKTANKIAHQIRINRPINSTSELANVIKKVLPRAGKIHPATRTFQAIRIAINDELRQLSETLEILPSLLNDNGRLAVITFHSLEDRIVKQFMNDKSRAGYESEIQLINKKPIVGSDDEIVYNPRSRSAKLRGAVKTKK